MAASDYFDDVQRAYIAYYGRPADAGGLSYWASQLDAVRGNLNAIIDAFAYSAESESLYGATSLADRIVQIYQQLLGRLPDDAGKSWWLDELQAGRKTLANLALDVLNGANSGDDALVVQNRLEAAQAFSDGLSASGFNYSGDTAAQFARDFLSDVMDDDASLNGSLSLLQSILSQIDKLSDDWDNSQSGGGNGGGDSGGSGGAELLPADMAALASLVTLDNETGQLSVSSIRAAVIAKTGSSAYYQAFDPSHYEGAGDGAFSPDELGISHLGTLPATTETMESLVYGTTIRTLKAIDMGEITAIQNFVTGHAQALQSGDEAVLSDYINLMVSVFEDPANPAIIPDAAIFDAVVQGTTVFVQLVGSGDSLALFDSLLMGFYPS